MTDTPATPASRDNLFGICAAVGQDLGFDPLWLRAAFAGALLFSLEAVLVTYAALGVVVLASRLLFPDRRTTQPTAEITPFPATSETAEEPLRRAA